MLGTGKCRDIICGCANITSFSTSVVLGVTFGCASSSTSSSISGTRSEGFTAAGKDLVGLVVLDNVGTRGGRALNATVGTVEGAASNSSSGSGACS